MFITLIMSFLAISTSSRVADGLTYTGPAPMDVRIADVRLSSITFLMLAILLLSAGCTEKEPAVVVDDRWNVDYAKNGCSMRAVTEEPCVSDPVAEVRRFEAQLGTSF